MSQEVQIKLKADTREAVKSVKDLEKQVANLENLEKKGGADKGFLSQDDVKQFRRLSQETERIYRDFFDKLNRVQRDIDKKKQQLLEAQKRGASQSSTTALNQEIKELEARRQILQSQSQHVNRTYNQGQQHQQTIQGYNTPGNMSTMLLGGGRQMIAGLGLMIGAGFLARTLQQGSNLVKSDEATMSQLGQRTGYQGDYDQGRKDAQEVGKRNGNAYTASETMQVADTLTSQAGYKSKEDMWAKTSEIQSASRILGIDANELASTYGNLGKRGALESNADFKKFKESMVGAIKETGMAGRDQEFIKAVDGLATQVGQGQLSLSNSELQNIIGLQTALGTTKGLEGEKGAEVISALDSGVKSGNASIDTMLGWGSKYQGIEGRAELERLKAQGIGSEEVQEALFGNGLTEMAGGNKDYQALWLKDNFGISMEQADALVEKAHSKEILNGKKKLEDSSEATKSEIEKRQQGWTDSKAQRDAENAVDWENTQKWGGQAWRDVWEGGKDLFFDQPEWLQWTEMGAGALGGGMLASRGGKALARKFSGKVGDGTKSTGKVSSAVKGAGKYADDLLKGGSTLAKGLKFLPFVGAGIGGVMETAESKANGEGWGKSLAKGAGSIVGGLAGGALGLIGGGGIASAATGTAGAIAGSKGGSALGEKIYDFFTGGSDETTKKSEEEVTTSSADYQALALKEQYGISMSQADKLVAKSGNNYSFEQLKALDKEQEIINSRKAINDAEHVVLDKEKKNIDDIKSVMGSESGSGGSSGGGFFSGLWSNIKSFFGFGGNNSTSSGVSATGTGYTESKSDFSGNTNAEKTWSFLKSKGFSDAAAAGIMGNLQQESGLDPTKKQNGGGPGRGIMQWEEGGRWDTLTAWAKNQGKDPWALETQLEYMYKEMNGGDSTGKSILNKKYGGLDGLKSATDTTWAVQAFEDSFERAGKPNYANRNKYANDIYSTFAGKSTWDTNTASLVTASSSRSSDSVATATAQTLNVNVSGSIDGLTKENNDLVASTIVNNLNNSSTISLAYQQRQGIGGKL